MSAVSTPSPMIRAKSSTIAFGRSVGAWCRRSRRVRSMTSICPRTTAKRAMSRSISASMFGGRATPSGVRSAASRCGALRSSGLKPRVPSWAAAQLSRALVQMAALPGTPRLRREQIRFQIALANALIHTKGYSAPETKASFDQARSLIEGSEALGEPLEDPLALFSVLYGFFVASWVAFNGNVCGELAEEFLELARKQGATIPLMVGHRVLGATLLFLGDAAEARAHCDRALALYDPAEHRPLATQFGQDTGVTVLIWRGLALWVLGHPEAGLADAAGAIRLAREIGQAATLMFALANTSLTQICVGNYTAVDAHVGEILALADEKGTSLWKAYGMTLQGCVLALTGRSSDAVGKLTAGIAAWRTTGATIVVPFYLAHLALAHAEAGNSTEAWRCVRKAMVLVGSTKEKLWEAEVNRAAGKLALLSRELGASDAQGYFERALAVAREQQAKSWELRASTSLARLWRDQGKRTEARDLLAPIYGWFTEGFDTPDVREAKVLLEELS
jgi:predicted ATPase